MAGTTAGALSIVERYARSKAQSVLSNPVDQNAPLGAQWTRCLAIAQHLADSPNAGGLKANTLQDLAIILLGHYPRGNPDHKLETVFSSALSQSPSLLKDFVEEVPKSFEQVLSMAVLESSQESSTKFIWRLSLSIAAITRVAPAPVLDAFSKQAGLFVALAKCYDTTLTHAITSQQQSSQLAVRAKANIIDALHVLFHYHLMKQQISTCLDMIFPILDLPTTEPPSSSSQPFESRTLLGDYEATYHLADRIPSADANDVRADFVCNKLRTLVGRGNSGEGIYGPGALSALIGDGGLGLSVLSFTANVPETSTLLVPSSTKGKGKAAPSRPSPLEGDLAPQITQILEILPDESPDFLEACLRHPHFSDGPSDSTAERVLGALLEGATLPKDLEQARSGEAVTIEVPAPPPIDLLASRSNAFDDAPMDFSRLRIGKNRTNADQALQDKSFAESMKEDILRRARAQMEEEEEAERQVRAGVLGAYATASDAAVRTVAHEDELSDDGGEADLRPPRGPMTDDGEASEDEHEIRQSSTETLENILELAYLANAKVFDRDANTRRSKARADLRAETGWDDEQIEGWKIMLDRNPLKDRILAKHDAGGGGNRNRAQNTADDTDDGGPTQGGRGGGGSRGGRGGGPRGGGGGRGRGRGSGEGGAQSARDRARKDRAGNQQRRRGHDKKMARGGANLGV